MLALGSIFTTTFGQDKEETWFDFWVGSWEVTWTDTNGSAGNGVNTVSKILDNMVIQENFEVRAGAMKGYRGMSLSVYDPKRRSWHQGYADNQGGYFNFIGQREAEKRIFKTETVTQKENKLIQRMVFYDITDNSFLWDWESSDDDGETWKLNWRNSDSHFDPSAEK